MRDELSVELFSDFEPTYRSPTMTGFERGEVGSVGSMAGYEVDRARPKSAARRGVPWSRLLAALLVLLLPNRANAFDETTVPDELAAWIPWVRAELGDAVCVAAGEARFCHFPGHLELELDDQGGTFALLVVSDQRGLVPLVGGPGTWPQEVRIDGTRAAVVEVEGLPYVESPPGRHLIRGEVVWSGLPKTLRIGEETAFVELSVAGVRAERFAREGAELWLSGLGKELPAEERSERVDLDVVRQIRDGIPLTIETRLLLQVSGRNREVTLPPPLLSGTQVLDVESDLALALEADGRLRVQLAPGEHAIRLTARKLEQTGELSLGPRGELWPSEEVWSFVPDPELRTVELSGLAGIDAARTRLPEQWRHDSAYLARPGDTLRLSTARRGQAQVAKNELQIQREWWLDESAKGFTVRDSLTGKLHQGFRLDFLGGDLGSVTVDGEQQLITEYGGHRGVELRDQDLSMQATSRVPRDEDLHAVGWSEDVDRLSGTLHLPPGWDVLAITGVDDASRTWVARWDLFDVFHLLLVTIALWRLSGAWAAGAALVALLLLRGESGAPEYVWLPLLALCVVHSLLEPGRLRSVVHWVLSALGLLTLVLLTSFAVDQVRLALYPHLDSHLPGEDDFGALMVDEPALEQVEEQAEAIPPVAPERYQEADVAEEADGRQLNGSDVPPSPPGKMLKKRQAIRGYGDLSSLALDASSGTGQKQLAPDAVVQTGPGIPEGAARSFSLSWSGPVHHDHKLSFWLLSPGAARALTALRLLAMAALAWFVWRVRARPATRGKGPDSTGPRQPSTRATPVAFLVAGLMAVMATLPATAHAEQPSSERLRELRERMLKPPACAPSCVSVSRLELVLDDSFTANVEVHAAARGLVRLPGPADALTVTELEVDGRPGVAARLGADSMMWVRVEPGVHEIRMGARWKSDRVTLDVGTSPQSIVVESDTWSVTGIDETARAPGGTITLQRESNLASQSGDAATDAGIQVAIPPYFHVERTLRFGVNHRFTTRVHRSSDPSTPEVFRLRLIPGEQVTTSGLEIDDGFVELSFPRESEWVELESTWKPPAADDEKETASPWSISLTAPVLSRSSETWNVECGVVRHCTHEGVVPTSRVSEGRALFTFEPWPEETLHLQIATPPPADGQSLTVHRATLTSSPGVRVTKGRLEFALQTSRAVVHALQIPPDARLESVEVDGAVQAVKAEGRTVRVSLSPGRRHVVVTWTTQGGISSWFVTPSVSTGAPGVNFRTVVDLSGARWLLFAWGPARGPALLFWGYLLLIFAAAWFLPRLGFAPLSRLQWLLLGLGLTQVPVVGALFIAGWFFAVGSRSSWPVWGRHRRNLVQLGLIAYTFAFVIALLGAVYDGLVSSPDMEVAGAGSYNGHLVWFVDRSTGALPRAWVLSVSVWIWRAFMLLWALWLSRSLLDWLRWAYETLRREGFWEPKPVAPSTPDHVSQETTSDDAPPSSDKSS